MKMVYVDLETTGLDPEKNGVIQIAAIVEIDGEVKELVNLTVRPFMGDIVTEEALKVNGRTIEDLRAFRPAAEVYNEFVGVLGKYVDKYDWKDKFLWVGYNALFDSSFMRAWFKKNDDAYFGSWFFFPTLDVMVLAAAYLMEDRAEMKNFQLGTVAEMLDVKLEGKLHDAMTDIRMTRDIFKKFKVVASHP